MGALRTSTSVMCRAHEMFFDVQFKLEGETRKYNVTASGTVPSDDAGSTTCTLHGDST